METEAKRREHLFVVRLWQEHPVDPSGKWRGSIEHVSTGERLFFAMIGDLTDFISARLNRPA